MSDNKKLLEVRKTIKSKKPVFIQQDFHKKRRLSLKWKRPTGLQSKMRHQFKGYSRRVKQGWRSPVEIRGFHSSGYESVIVNNVQDLDNVQKHQGIIISANVGAKKKLLIIDKAQKMQIQILNIKAEDFKKKIAEKKSKTVEDKKSKEDKKKKTLEDSLKKAEKLKQDKEKSSKKSEESDTQAEEQAVEEKKEEEKKVKDDVLIHKQ